MILHPFSPIGPKPTTWLGDRLQGNGLCQADEGFDAEQVGQHHRFFCQELVKGQHTRM